MFYLPFQVILNVGSGLFTVYEGYRFLSLWVCGDPLEKRVQQLEQDKAAQSQQLADGLIYTPNRSGIRVATAEETPAIALSSTNLKELAQPVQKLWQHATPQGQSTSAIGLGSAVIAVPPGDELLHIARDVWDLDLFLQIQPKYPANLDLITMIMQDHKGQQRVMVVEKDKLAQYGWQVYGENELWEPKERSLLADVPEVQWKQEQSLWLPRIVEKSKEKNIQVPPSKPYQRPQAASHPTASHSAPSEPDRFNQRNTTIELILNFIFNRNFLYVVSGLAFVGLVYFINPHILVYLPSDFQDSGATTKICKLATTNSQLTDLLNRIKRGEELASSQKDTNGTTAAANLLKHLANSPSILVTTDCDTLVNLLFAYRVAIWCKDYTCTPPQKITTAAIKVTPAFNNGTNDPKISKLVGCADKTKAPTKDCRIKVIQGLFPNKVSDAYICPDSQTKLKAPEQRERVKIWIAAASKAKGLQGTAHTLSNGQKPIIGAISQRLTQNQELDARAWLTTIQDLFEYNLALKCKAIPICGNINIIIDSAPENEVTASMFQYFNQELPPTCRVTDESKFKKEDFKKVYNKEYMDFLAAVVLPNIVQDPPTE
ncbi:hypothetical protein TI05_04165 [Achromatium sp. WMS3]|nr:hypothetical protein TI05_04165 [Achromatium sp. WMS3]